MIDRDAIAATAAKLLMQAVFRFRGRLSVRPRKGSYVRRTSR